MTFSLIARCPMSEAFGVVISSSSPCVASRCAWARANVGAVASQNVTDPRLGVLGLDLLGQGFGAQATLERLVEAGAYPEYRQLAVIDNDGGLAHHSGAKTLGLHRAVTGEACIAAGNILANDAVPEAMVAAYREAPREDFPGRLLAGLEAGLRAGGEEGDVRSAGVYVVHRHVFPIVDLRVDWHDDPIAELGSVWQVYKPQMNDYLTRALDPTGAPAYGVPGDPGKQDRG